MAKAPNKKPRKKATNGYKMPDPLPEGEILTDVTKNRWKLGTSIGKGGFGEIYAAQEASKSSTKYPYVIKVEPHGNGPLFVEMHFYMKNAKQSDIDAFMKKHKLKTFGMPAYLGSGSHEVGPVKYRFIVMEKFGSDIDKLRQEKGALASATVFQLAWQIAFVLEYIHGLGYVHADIKGGNVLLGITAETKNQAYLLDFGLATKFTTEEFKPNPKKAHDGTIEFLSRDAHQGVPTRRGDFEILAYNIIQWLGGNLPWETKLDNPKIVQQMKEDSMSNIPEFLKACLKKNHETLAKFLQYTNNLKFNEEPDYKKIRTLFEREVQKNGATVNGALQFNSLRKRRSFVVDGDTAQEKNKDEDHMEVKKPAIRKGNKTKQVEKPNSTEEIMTDAMKEMLAKKEKNAMKKKKLQRTRGGKVNGRTNGEEFEDCTEEIDRKLGENNKEKFETSSSKNNMPNGKEFEGYTAEMVEIKKKKIASEKIKGKTKRSPRRNEALPNEEEFEGYTAEMINLKKKKLDNDKNKGQTKKSPKSEEENKGVRPRRNLPICNYDER